MDNRPLGQSDMEKNLLIDQSVIRKAEEILRDLERHGLAQNRSYGISPALGGKGVDVRQHGRPAGSNQRAL